MNKDRDTNMLIMKGLASLLKGKGSMDIARLIIGIAKYNYNSRFILDIADRLAGANLFQYLKMWLMKYIANIDFNKIKGILLDKGVSWDKKVIILDSLTAYKWSDSYKKEIVSMFSNETNVNVRTAYIDLFGHARIREALPILRVISTNTNELWGIRVMAENSIKLIGGK